MVPVNLIEPYQISNTIRNAVGEDDSILRARPGRVLRRSTRIKKKKREE